MAKRAKVVHRANAGASPGQNRDWEARDAMHTLRRAEEIKADKKLHTAAKACAKDEAHHLSKIARRK